MHPAGGDLRSLVCGGVRDIEISDAISEVWRDRNDRYSEMRAAATVRSAKMEMSYVVDR